MRDIIKTSASLTAVLICCVLAAGCSKSIPAEVEPNNTFNTAMKLEDNGAVTGYFNSADDVDCYQVTLHEPAVLDISLNAVRGINHSIKIWRRDGEPRLLKYIDDFRKSSPERFCNMYADRGVYYITVQHGDKDPKRPNTENPYTLSLKARSLAFLEEKEPNDGHISATPVTVGKEISGYFSPVYDRLNQNADHPFREEDWYALDIVLEGETPSLIDVELSGVPGVNSVLYVYNAAMGEVGAYNVHGIGKGESARGIGVTASGRYYIMVTTEGYQSNCDVPYQIYVSQRPYDSTMEMEPNNTVGDANPLQQSEISGKIFPGGDKDMYKIPGPGRPTMFTIEAAPPETIDISVNVYNEAGETISGANQGKKGVPEILPNVYASKSLYVEVLSRRGDSDEQGTYRLMVSSQPYINGYEIEPNGKKASATAVSADTVTGYTSFQGDVDYYFLEYPKRKTLRFTAKAALGSKIKVSVTDPLGYIIRSERISGDAEKSFTEMIDGKGYLIIESLEANYREPYTIEIQEEK
ncbi:MAG TPA: hypothetical protein PK253_12310 [Spirochaetota bacterium]|nr:hypothetical protein [Spirochaetota bacterium]